MPAAARYNATGEPNPPVPITSAEEALSFFCPSSADFGDQQVARITQDLFVGKFCRHLNLPRCWGSAVVVGLAQRRIQTLQVVDVFFTLEQIDKRAQFAIVLQDMLLDGRVTRRSDRRWPG